MAAPLELALKPAAKYELLLVERVYSVSRLLDGNEELIRRVSLRFLS